MKKLESLSEKINQHFGEKIEVGMLNLQQLTIEVSPANAHAVLMQLRDHVDFQFDMLIDICGVDYLDYGNYEWDVKHATEEGFSRGVLPLTTTREAANAARRFAVVYHLLSIRLNQRIRVKVFCDTEQPLVDSVIDIWQAADWFEREAYDLFGILFNGHPDLRRILTDYGFIGHPFRKDFPLIGTVEMRYDAKVGKVVYGPVEIEPRTLVPKVARPDNNYQTQEPPHG